MTPRARHDRTVRLLAAKLEEIAIASERRPVRGIEIERGILRAAAATRNAVELELLSADEAGAIWADVAARHPGTPWPGSGPLLAA
jgi:hypothetical protein